MKRKFFSHARTQHFSKSLFSVLFLFLLHLYKLSISPLRTNLSVEIVALVESANPNVLFLLGHQILSLKEVIVVFRRGEAQASEKGHHQIDVCGKILQKATIKMSHPHYRRGR